MLNNSYILFFYSYFSQLPLSKCYNFTYYCIFYFSFHNLLKRGVRIASRSKVNDSLITGSRIVDSILPVGRGQRQLILGDRYTGKTPIYLSLALHCNYLSCSGPIEGLGTKRLFAIYIGINQNPSKSSKLIDFP